jgi:hypothetical protein
MVDIKEWFSGTEQIAQKCMIGKLIFAKCNTLYAKDELVELI